VDWDRFALMAARHRIEGLALHALRRAGIRLPPRVDRGLAAAAARIVRQGLGLAAEAIRLQGLLDQEGIACLILKGATLDRLAFGAIGLKDARDIDILVMPAARDRAREILEQAGYVLTRPSGLTTKGWKTWTASSKECVFTHGGRGLIVELHWRAVDAATLLPSLTAESPSQTVALSKALNLRTFAPDALFSYLCVHGASHGWSRLKWLADLNALIASEKPAGLEHLYQRSIVLDAGLCSAQALLLCHRLLGLELAPSLQRVLGARFETRWLVALAMDALTGGGEAEIAERPLGPERLLLAHLLFARGWRDRWAELRRQWISLDDRLHIPLPPGLGWLYSAIRIPSWLWRRIVSRR
jgi:hypothetical protein